MSDSNALRGLSAGPDKIVVGTAALGCLVELKLASTRRHPERRCFSGLAKDLACSFFSAKAMTEVLYV